MEENTRVKISSQTHPRSPTSSPLILFEVGGYQIPKLLINFKVLRMIGFMIIKLEIRRVKARFDEFSHDDLG